MPHQPGALGHAGDIGVVADQVLGGVEGGAGGLRQQARVAGTEADDGDASTESAALTAGGLRRHQHHREIGGDIVGLLRQRHHPLARHGAPLDIDRTVEEAGLGEHGAHLRQMAAELHDDGGVRPAQALRQGGTRERCGQDGQHVVTPGDRRAGRVQQPDMPVTPGITSTGKRSLSRRHRCMNEP